jgi:hypothetical protein
MSERAKYVVVNWEDGGVEFFQNVEALQYFLENENVSHSPEFPRELEIYDTDTESQIEYRLEHVVKIGDEP